MLAAEARAEGDHDGAVISPDKAAEFLSAAAAEAAATADQETTDATEAQKSTKIAKGSDKRKAKEAAAAAKAQDGKVPDSKVPDAKPLSRMAVEAAALSEDETASVPATPVDAALKLRSSDSARGTALRSMIVRYASENGLPYELADAVVRLESRYNAGARNGPNLGLTQINVRTAQSLGYQGPAAGLLDAETNLRYGLKYLARAYKLAGGDTCGTILRYQFGHRAQTMTGASRVYCAKVKVITAAAD